MAKKPTVEEMVVNKITPLELANLTELVNQKQNLMNELAGIEIAKHNILKENDKLQSYFDEKGKELEEKYGKINIDLKTGEYVIDQEVQE